MMRERARPTSNGLLAAQNVVYKLLAIGVGLVGRILVPYKTDEGRTMTDHSTLWRVSLCLGPWLGDTWELWQTIMNPWGYAPFGAAHSRRKKF